ncbi:MAG: 2,3-bisphosphoglycerate-independent phosphoglycerate mutase [Thermodesulfobacteriota bacterium]
MSQLKLKPIDGFKGTKGPVVLVIMDGVGIGKKDESDGVHMAYKPVLDELFKEPLFTKLKAHGKAVGLPSDDDMGNSEVGHNALGAGRVFSQGAKLVNEAIASKKIFQSQAWGNVKKRMAAGGTLHLIGMVSDGNVHSHIDQLFALLDRAAEEGFKRLRVHGLLDGRDVGEKSGLTYFESLEKKLAGLSKNARDYRIASGGGRMVTTMDRYNANWGVVEKGWKAHVLGQGRGFTSACEAIKTYYAEDPNITDQYMDSFVIVENGKPIGTIENGDAVVFFNFRGDRAIEISRAFDEKDFREFDRQRVPEVFYAGMMQYDGDAAIPKNYLVEPPEIDRTIGQYLCGTGLTSYAISETQKYGHVTYFWNGNNSGYIDEKLETYVEIPSDKVTFDLRPWMKAAEITDAVVEVVKSGKYRFIRLNLANGDMVGHTGVPISIRIAVECVDLSLRRIAPAVEAAKGTLVVTADHGNADCMWTESKGVRSPMVAHTLNPVPFIVKDYSGHDRFALASVDKPRLSNVAATLCNLLGYHAPEDYDPSLIITEARGRFG